MIIITSICVIIHLATSIHKVSRSIKVIITLVEPSGVEHMICGVSSLTRFVDACILCIELIEPSLGKAEVEVCPVGGFALSILTMRTISDKL